MSASIGDLRHIGRDEETPEQLSLEVGVPAVLEDALRVPTIAFSGTLDLKGEIEELALDIGDELTVTINGPDGTVLAAGIGRIGSVPIIEHEGTSNSLPWIERRHKAKLRPRQ